MQPEQQQRIMGYFIEEAKDHLNTIEQGLLNLQSTIEDPEMVNELFRAAHSVKGGAAMLGLHSIQQVSHRLEDFFKVLKESRVTVDQKLESLFLKVFDALQELLEQLQGPFGLTEETANTTLSAVQPTFEELERHLETLVLNAGDVMTSMPTTGFLVEEQPIPAESLDVAVAQVFGTEIPSRLREMLQLFKQPETDANSRQQLQAICRDFLEVGEQFGLSAWCQLIETARQAIANPNNSYRALAPVVIKDIKQAQELVLAGQADEIAPCSQLQTMAPTASPVTIAADDDFADLLATVNNTDLEIDFSASSEQVTEEALFGDLELTPTTELDLSSDLDFGASFGGEGLTADTEQHGPEVGMAELNSLADLFEGEVPDLGSTWQEEEIVGDVADIFSTSSTSTSGDLDDSADFSDLLFEEPSASNATARADEAGLSDLFGDDLLEDEHAGSDPGAMELAASESLNDSDLGDLENLLAISEMGQSPADNLDAIAETATETDPFAGFVLDEGAGMENLTTTDLNLESVGESETALGDLGELFAGMDETDLSELQTESEALFPPDTAGDDFNPFAPPNSEPATGSDSATNAAVADPWDDTSGNLTGESFSELTQELSPEPRQASPIDTSDLDSLLNDDSLSETIETLTDQSDLDFSGLFESPSTSDQEASENLFVEELIDEPLDFSTESWLSNTDNAGVTEPQTKASLPNLDQPPGEDELEAFASLETEFGITDSSASQEGGLDLDLSELNLDNAETATEVTGAEPGLDLERIGVTAETSDASASLVSEERLEEDLGLDFSELDLGSSEAENEIEVSAKIPDASAGLTVEERAVEEDLSLDLNELDLRPSETENLNLDADSEQDLEDLLGEMGLGDLDSEQPSFMQSFDLPETIDSGMGLESENGLFADTAADPFAEDWAAIVGEEAEIVPPEVSETPSVDELSLGDFTTESPLESLETELTGDAIDLNRFSEESPTDLEDLLLDEETSPPQESTPETVDFNEFLESTDSVAAADDFADLGDLLDEPLDEPTSEPANDLSDLENLLSEESSFEAADEAENLNPLLADEFSLAATTDLGDLDSFLSEEASFSTEECADLGNLVEEEALAPDDSSNLENLFEENPAPSASINALDALETIESGAQNLTGTEEFADLEALLQDDESSSSLPQPIETSSISEFDELDDLLKDAEEKMGGSPSVSISRGMASQNRRLTRPGRVFSEQTMRVPVKHLDNLSNLVGELVVNRNSLEQDQERLRQSLDNLLYRVQQLSDIGQRMQDLYERSLLESSLLASRHSYRQGSSSAARQGDTATQTASENVEYDPLEMDRFTGFHSLSQEMIELIVRVRESASDIEFIVDETDQVTRMFRQVTTQLQEGLTRSRMVPFAQTADRLPRAVRDIAMRVGKQAELIIEGRETLIDKMILEQLYDPMTHLVNNAITHGIESPEVRRAAGKPAAGRITIRAFHQGNQTIISVSDDGAGIDIERVKAKAIEKGLITPAEARSMSRLDVYDLLFHPGFSTKDQADDFSGRGVGMDVVRTSLSEIRGVINTDSNFGKGTTFTIRLPLTLSISKALCCISDRARIAFPMDGVEDMLDVPKERIQTNAEGQSCLPWRDSLLPLHPLVDLLSYNRHLSRGNVYGGNQEDDIASIVVLRSAGNFLALQVDQVLGEQEIVIKQLEGPVPKPIGVAGATVLGDGRIMPIADVLELIDLAMGRIRKDAGGSLWEQGAATVIQEPPATKTEPMVLIVDDSITVRELLSMTFNKVGYRVEQARDGQEAWEKLRSGLPCDIVFCDIEMPRMDGLELLSRIQKDPNLNHLPIAMLTSRGADRHRQMAASLGASGYFTKPYLEEALLDAAQRMLKGERLLS
ncbi:response regulator [Leptothermofonsia sp. ETS-13]|uniref:hybrid sensor histidine kinase/response regulator n=1 Tax=Leptothermofonsia sp. ETS-13 TaxID=3035696 RepID=UPI003B9EBA85